MAEEVTQYRDDMEADNKRHLLSALTACVPQVLPFLETSMEGHFGQALAASQQGQHQLSQLHAAVVTSALGEMPDVILQHTVLQPMPLLSTYLACHWRMATFLWHEKVIVATIVAARLHDALRHAA